MKVLPQGFKLWTPRWGLHYHANEIKILDQCISKIMLTEDSLKFNTLTMSYSDHT